MWIFLWHSASSLLIFCRSDLLNRSVGLYKIIFPYKSSFLKKCCRIFSLNPLISRILCSDWGVGTSNFIWEKSPLIIRYLTHYISSIFLGFATCQCCQPCFYISKFVLFYLYLWRRIRIIFWSLITEHILGKVAKLLTTNFTIINFIICSFVYKQNNNIHSWRSIEIYLQGKKVRGLQLVFG